VGRIRQIDRRIDNAFAKVHATPMAQARGRHMLVLPPVSDWPERPAKTEPAPRTRKDAKAAATPAKATAPEGGQP
jgi:rod shape-determining protein MreC